MPLLCLKTQGRGGRSCVVGTYGTPNPANFRFEIGVDVQWLRALGVAAAVSYPLRRRTAQSTEPTSLAYLIQ